ncbi:NGG1p interacting factor NIF3 [Spirochaetia bacterium 38H-sp]|uniref:NGG1p interacting factor NIF3 n=1 Tax=Rarispira pelagica TaxID=3141764 RepID=A0ABU9UA88_9SPIR
MADLYRFEFYVPVSHAEEVKAAVFSAGAGRYEGYDMCAWETRGTGQFRPLAGSNPFIGSYGAVEKVEELKVECVCEASVMPDVLRAFFEAHPYEEPAYAIFKMYDVSSFIG